MNGGKLNYVVVGAFVLAMLVALVASLAVLMGRTGATDDYHALYRNVTGVKFGTQVLYEGYPIGQVEEVTPESVDNGMRFRVDFAVEQGWRIPEDSVAAIKAPRLLAAVTIDIQAGESAKALTPGSLVPSREGADVFSAVSSLAAQVGSLTKDGLEPLLATIEETVGTARDVLGQDVRPLARNLASLAESMNARLPAIIDKVDRFADTMNATATDVRALVGPENQEKVAALIGNLDRSAANLSALSVKLDRVATTLDGVVGDNRVNIDRSLSDLRHIMRSMARNIDSVTQNLDGASRNMYEFSRQIRQNPGTAAGRNTARRRGTHPVAADKRKVRDMRKWAWTGVVVSLMLAACAQPEVPADRFYRIEAPQPEPATARPRFAGALEVEDVRAVGLTAGRAIVHADSASPNALETYSYHFWAEPPAHMVRDALVRCLRESKIAGSVVTESMRVDPSYSLVSRLQKLERLTGAAPRAVMEMEIALRDNDRGGLLNIGAYRAEAVPADDTIESAVDAFNAAFAEICTELAADLASP